MLKLCFLFHSLILCSVILLLKVQIYTLNNRCKFVPFGVQICTPIWGADMYPKRNNFVSFGVQICTPIWGAGLNPIGFSYIGTRDCTPKGAYKYPKGTDLYPIGFRSAPLGFRSTPLGIQMSTPI